jgi:hypothetical protein
MNGFTSSTGKDTGDVPRDTAAQSAAADLRTLLAEAGAPNSPAWVTGLRADQARRWRRGERIRAEDYLALLPELAANSEAILDLVYHEVLLREQEGEAPRLEEYLERFPAYEAGLHRQFAVHAMLASASDANALAPSTLPPMPFPSAGDRETATEGPRSGLSPAPANISGYEVLGVLGRGGMGIVYKARQRNLNRLVALKMVLAGEHAAEEARTRFRREAEAVARLSHPNIV